MKKHIYAITVIAITVFSLTGIYLYITNKNTDNPTTDDRITSAIIDAAPFLSSEGSPVFKIKSVNKSDNWYAVTIESLRETATHIPVYVILVKNNGKIQTVLGPDTHFTEAEMLKYNVPDPIVREFSSL